MDQAGINDKPLKGCIYIKIVGYGSIIISGITLLLSMLLRIYLNVKDTTYNQNSVSASHFIIGLVAPCVSIYQLVISAMVLLLAYGVQTDDYCLTLWYISHLSILPLYWSLFAMELFVCILQERYALAGLAGALILLYQVPFTYFTVVIDKVMSGKIGVKP